MTLTAIRHSPPDPPPRWRIPLEFARVLWMKIHEPRHVTAGMFTMYLTLAAGGMSALISPPGTIEGQIGEWAMTTLAGMLTFGGILGAVVVLPGLWKVERTAIGAILTALGIYAYIVLSLHLGGNGSRLLQLSVILSLAYAQIMRLIVIRQRPVRPSQLD